MKDTLIAGIHQRIAKIRTEVAGSRGKSNFAKQLGISPSTYDYYESTRVPPADILVKMADLAKVDLRWLLTGQAPTAPAVPIDHPALRRAATLLAEKPNAAGPLAAFLDLLAESLKFPTAKDAARAGSDKADMPCGQAATQVRLDRVVHVEAAAPSDLGEQSTVPPGLANQAVNTGTGGESLIPILGRSAAGIPQFWTDVEEARNLTTLTDIIRRHGARRHSRPATVSQDSQSINEAVSLVTLSEPDDNDVVEFVSSASLKAAYADAFAVRIDGDSMVPDILHADLVVLSPSVPARNGRCAVVQLENQIGVTCKLYRRNGEMVHLVPINERYQPTAVPANQVVWALRVLARVRG